MATDITLPLVVITALVDSINPCAIGVLILLIATLLGLTKERSRMLFVGLVYIGMVYLVYLLAGFGLIWFQSYLILMGLAAVVGTIVGLFVIVLGIIEVKDFFWYGRGYSLGIPVRFTDTIKRRARDASIVGAIALGALVSLVELPCTGGPYLAITNILATRFDLLALYYLLIYNFLFVLPLIIILFLAYWGTTAERLRQWKEDEKRWMRLAAGILLIGLGLFLVFFYQGVPMFGLTI